MCSRVCVLWCHGCARKVCAWRCVHVHLRLCVCVFLHVHVSYVCVFACVYVFMCVCVRCHVCVCACVCPRLPLGSVSVSVEIHSARSETLGVVGRPLVVAREPDQLTELLAGPPRHTKRF